MKNKKGFTLVELLSVIVIISILLLLAIPSVTKYVVESRKKAFVEDAKTVLSTVRSNYATGAYDLVNGVDESKKNKVIYNKQAIDSILVNKLGRSPFGSNYKYAEVIIHKTSNQSDKPHYDYYICLIDEDGNGFDNQNEKDVNVRSLNVNQTYSGCSGVKSDNYTVRVVVFNATVNVDSISQIEEGGSASFNLAPNNGAFFKSVSCTNGQRGVVSSNVLKVNNVTGDTTCTVIYELRTYTILYEQGKDKTSTGLPERGVKNYGQTIKISEVEPKSNTNAFLGWSTSEQATTSSLWYDGGTNYSDNKDLVLKAQWYDVNSLEKDYTRFITSNDFHIEKETQTFTMQSGEYLTKSFSYPNVPGYRMWMKSGWNIHDGARAWSNDVNSIGYLAMMNLQDKSYTNRWLYVKEKNATTYASDKIDTRIDRLQKIQDVSLVFNNSDHSEDEIKEKGENYTKTMSPRTNFTFATNTLDGWSQLANLGFFITQVSSDSTDPNYKCSMTNLYTETNTGHARIQNNSITNTIDVLVQPRWLYVKNKTARTTTYNPNALSSKGASRLKALEDLYNSKNKYLYEDNLKTMCVDNGGTNLSVGAWPSSVYFEKFIRIPDGTLLGTYAYHTDQKYANVYQNYLNGTLIVNGGHTCKQLRLYIVGGNKDFSTEQGESFTISQARSCFGYISSGTASLVSKCG